MRITIVIALLFIPFHAYAQNQDNVPIPPKRPKVLSVSPSYIEKLKQREKTKTKAPTVEMFIDTIENIEPEAGEYMHVTDKTPEATSPSPEDDLVTSLLRYDIPPALDLESAAPPRPNIPIPGYKPSHLGKNEIISYEDLEQRLVSFSIPPRQIKLDKNLEMFLKEHALDLFNQNRGLKLDIQAYATAEEDNANSDVRIALARALEVRKFLLDHNIEPGRIKLSPLGQNKNGNSDDRIDLVFVDIPLKTP